MRNAYIVSYDISHPKRLRRVYKCLLGFGERLQLSVFRCELSSSDLVRIVSRLEEIIHNEEDQVLFVNIGPAPGRSDRCMRAIGRPYAPVERSAIVV